MCLRLCHMPNINLTATFGIHAIENDYFRKIREDFLMNTDTFIYILEMIGTIAFASSGSMVAIRKNMDLFGVNVLGVTTAVGGGCIRDIILGITPPKMFQDYSYAGAAVVTSCLLFLLFYLNKELLSSKFVEIFEQVMNILDAIGLGIFTVMGMQTAIDVSFGNNSFLLLFVGMITGVGGGMLRDIMAGMTPFVFVKHVYACAALGGALLYLPLHHQLSEMPSIISSASVIVLIRLLAAHYRWNLPRICPKGQNDYRDTKNRPQ